MTIDTAKMVADRALADHDAEGVDVAADAFEEAGDMFVASNLRWRAREIRNGSPWHPWSW